MWVEQGLPRWLRFMSLLLTDSTTIWIRLSAIIWTTNSNVTDSSNVRAHYFRVTAVIICNKLWLLDAESCLAGFIYRCSALTWELFLGSLSYFLQQLKPSERLVLSKISWNFKFYVCDTYKYPKSYIFPKKQPFKIDFMQNVHRSPGKDDLAWGSFSKIGF